MKKNKQLKPQKFLKCVKNTQGKDCGEMMELYDEGIGKYWLYRCSVHGLISVMKGSRSR